MKPHTIQIRAVRGFQKEKEIPLSPSLTVVYGDNGRGKTSLCEGVHWLFTGEMREGLEPQSEIGGAGQNIHVDVQRRVRILSKDGHLLAERDEEDLSNPAGLPFSTSPVLLQYQLQQVLYTSEKSRRQFFEQVLELDVESEFAQKLRRACQQLSPFDHDLWKTWKRAVKAVPDEEWDIPSPEPVSKSEQIANEEALIGQLADYFGCEASLDAVRAVLGSPDDEVDVPVEKVGPPVSESLKTEVEEAQEAIEDLNEEAEKALNRASWRKTGFEDFLTIPVCPFCEEETVDESKAASIASDIETIETTHREHTEAKNKLGKAISAISPLIELDVDATSEELEKVKKRVRKLDIEDTTELFELIDGLQDLLSTLSEERPEAEDLEEPDEFRDFSTLAVTITSLWFDLVPKLRLLKEKLERQRLRIQYTQAATAALDYHDSDRGDFYGRLEVQRALDEIADAAPDAVQNLKAQKLGSLADNIVDYYRVLRPSDHTPLEEIKSAGGVKGNIRIMARSQDKLEHASALFSYSNANALGMAAHISRVLDAGHKSVILDDPFQSLDASNRKYVIQRLVSELLEADLQVVIVTHQRKAAQELIDRYVSNSARGVQLSWDPGKGAVPQPMYAGNDRLLEQVLNVLERDDSTEILKGTIAVRQLIEGFCHEYLVEVGGELPPAGRENLGHYISQLEALPEEVRPRSEQIHDLKSWNKRLSTESHSEGAGIEGMEELREITRYALEARRQEKQLRPPDVGSWPQVPRSGGLQRRSSELLGI